MTGAKWCIFIAHSWHVETVSLIQINIEKVSNVDRSVTDITNDATALGANIKIVGSAVKEVENSNKTLPDNMHQVCDLMEVMTERINRAEFTTKEMLSKYDESARSAGNIETVVGHLTEEIGIGGFMGVQDVSIGMKIAVTFKDTGVSRESLFATMKGKDVLIDIKDFDILQGKELEGCIIRVSNNDGEYVVGCRMSQDSEIIKDYVSKNYSE